LDPDPGQPNYCGSGFRPESTTLSVRHNFKKYGVHFETTYQNHTLIFYFPSRFEVSAEQRTFFSDVNFHRAAATFFHAVCVGKLRYSEEAESVAIWLQRKVAGINEPSDKSISFSISGSGIISGFIILDPKIRIRIKMSRIRSTAPYSVCRGNSVTQTKIIRFGFRKQIRNHETILVKMMRKSRKIDVYVPKRSKFSKRYFENNADLA
jgi:hypothetical protein